MLRVRERVFALDAGLQRDAIRDNARWIIIVRILEGLALWLVFSEVYSRGHRQELVVMASMTFYMLSNLFLALRYRSGDVRLVWVAFDLVANLVPVTLVVEASGGLASPAFPVYLLKMAGYALIFSFEIGVISMVCTALAIGSFGAASLLDFEPILRPRPISESLETDLRRAWHAALVLVLLGGAIRLRQRTRQQQEVMRLERDRARATADRESNIANTALRLVQVNDATSRQTRLDDVLAAIVEVGTDVLSVDQCGVLEWDEEAGCYRGKVISGVDEETRKAFREFRVTAQEWPDLDWTRFLKHCTISQTENTPLGPDTEPSILLAPLHGGGRFFGVLLFARRRGQTPFTQREMRVADGVAGQVGVALERTSLIENALRLGQAVDSTDEGMLITDAFGRVVHANPAFLAMLGYHPEEVIGHDAFSLVRGIPGPWLDEVARVVGSGQTFHGETLAQRKDGTEFPLLLDANIIFDEGGSVQGVVAVVEDISERKRAQEQMQRSDRLAAAGEMAAGIAHEVNNALGGILSEVQHARKDRGAESLQKALDRIEDQSNRIAAIVKGLLGFARPATPSREATPVRALIEETLALKHYDLESAGIAVDFEARDDLPALWIDRKQIQQVLINLITNAQQAMPGGGRLTIRAARVGAAIVIEVEDTGIGIAPDLIDRIFDPFVTTKASGTGLGLSVSYQIAHAHEGDLSVRSTPGEGTCFSLSLPPVVNPSRGRVLVVDDEPGVAASLVEILQQDGHCVDLIESGIGALARLRADPNYDAVFLDVRLPDLSGPQVFEQLAETHPEQARRVIFVTGGLWRSGRSLRDSLPPQPALAKPWTTEQVRQIMQTLRQQLAAAA